ncbi:MAG: hypothetical protein ACUVUG_01705 [Candidatus Aminicenantia bacterium]
MHKEDARMKRKSASIVFVILVTYQLASKDVAEIRVINLKSQQGYTRIVSEVSHPIEYKYGRITNSERIYAIKQRCKKFTRK